MDRREDEWNQETETELASANPIEREVTEALMEREPQSEDPQEGARRRLAPRYEIRVQAMTDPIVEETRRVRRIAQEVDGRYDKYMERADGAEEPDNRCE